MTGLAGLPNVSIRIACIAVLSLLCTVEYVMEATGLSREQLHRVIERGTDAGSVRGILRQHHQTKIDRNDRMRGGIGVEAVGKLRAIGAEPISQQLLDLAVEGFGPLADFRIGGSVGGGVDR